MAVLPDFSAATFVPGAAIDNTYFPLTPNQILSYKAEETDPDTGEVSVETDDLHHPRNLHRSWRRDHRRPRHGLRRRGDPRGHPRLPRPGHRRNVWYFGEVVINYEYDDEGNFIGTNRRGCVAG